MKTLAMIKMEKNFIAHNEKKYPRQPYKVQTTKHLLGRLEQEVKELKEACAKKDTDAAKLECGDVSNIVDYIFERISSGRLR